MSLQRALAVLACLLFCSGSALASAVLKLDAALDELISPDARLDTLLQLSAGTMETFECPTWVHGDGPGFLIFCNVPGNAIYKLRSDATTEVFLDRIYTGSFADANRGSVPGRLMLGANGATLDRQGRIVYASFSAGQIVRVEKDGARTVLAERFEGSRFNAPNDLVFRSDGALYFTESRGSSEQTDSPDCGKYWMVCGPEAKGRVRHMGVYLLKAGEVRLVSTTIPKPNGLALSPDEKHLYVANSLGSIVRFDIQHDGTLANETIFVDMTQQMQTSGMRGNPDGIKVDKQGNVYCSGPGGIWILSSAGKHLGTILVEQGVTNFTFGDDDARTLYITSSSAAAPPKLFRIRMKTVGVRP